MLKIMFIDINTDDMVYQKKLNKTYCILITTMLILVAGLRSYQIGNDPKMYKIMFDSIKYFSLKDIISMPHTVNNTEKGYVILENIISKTFGGFQWLMVIVAIVYTVPIGILVKRYSKNPWISFFLFVGFGFFTDSLTALRQALAVGLTVVAFMCIKNKKLKRYSILVLIASSFHMSGLFFMPKYWLRKIKYTKKIVIGSMIAIIVTNIFKSPLFQFVNRFSRQVYDVDASTGGTKLYVLIIFTFILCSIYGKAMIKENKDNKMIIYMMIITAIIYPILSFNPAVYRMLWYFFIYLIIFVPNLLSVVKEKTLKYIIFTGYMLMSIFFFTSVSLRPISLMSPFIFFWQ
jgi:hypothetical protein